VKYAFTGGVQKKQVQNGNEYELSNLIYTLGKNCIAPSFRPITISWNYLERLQRTSTLKKQLRPAYQSPITIFPIDWSTNSIAQNLADAVELYFDVMVGTPVETECQHSVIIGDDIRSPRAARRQRSGGSFAAETDVS
jgi:hypothetical protein